MSQPASQQPAVDLEQQLFAGPAGIEDMYRNTALDMLVNNVFQQLGHTEQIQVIKGESGLGKSCFCQRLIYEAPQDTQITLVTATRKTGVTEILKQISNRDEPGHDAPLQLLAKAAAQKIYQHLYNQLQPVVLIDDAHQLSTQTLANLLRFQHAIAQQNSGGFKLILIGERKVDSRLEAIDKKIIDRERFIGSLLRPLNRNEIADYLNFKLARVQTEEKPALNDKQIAYIRSNSGGIPGKIETLALRALGGKTSGSRSSLLTVLFAGVLLAGGLAYYHHDDFFKPSRLPMRIKPAPATPPPNIVEESSPIEVPATDVPTTVDETIAVVDETPQTPGSLAWLSNQPAEHYLIQLVGGQDAEKMESYQQSLRLPYPLTLHATVRNGQDWYLLFYGPFPDYESAVDAREQLPEDLRKNQPWIRQIGSILEKQ